MKLLDVAMDFWDEHSTQILSAIAIGGAILAPVLASRATLKAKKEIDKETWNAMEKASSEYASTPEKPDEDEDALKDDILDKHGLVRKTVDDHSTFELKPWNKVKIGWKYYIFTAICVGVIVVSVAGCEKVHLGRELELGTLVSFWEQRYLTLDRGVRRKYGAEEILEIKKSESKWMNENVESETDPRKIQSIRNERFWIYDTIGEDYNKTCINDLSAAMCRLNQDVGGVYGRATYNDFRRFLGWKPCAGGDKIGWNRFDQDFIELMSYNGESWIDLKLDGPGGIDAVGDELAYTFWFNFPPEPFKKS